MRRRDLRNFYEKQAEQVGNKVISPSLQRKYNEVVRTVLYNKSYGSSILDVGCQVGGLSIILSMLGYKCTAIDLSNNYLTHAKYNSKRMKIFDYIKFKRAFAEDIDEIFETELLLVVIQAHIQPSPHSISTPLHTFNRASSTSSIMKHMLSDIEIQFYHTIKHRKNR